MKAITFFVIFQLACVFRLAAQQNDTLYLYCPDPYEEVDLRCEYRNAQGETVIPAGKYHGPWLSRKFAKFAIVGIKGRQGIYLIDRAERILFEFLGTGEGAPDDVSNGLVRIVDGDKMGFGNMEGEIVIKPRFEYVSSFREDGFAIFKEGGRREYSDDGEHWWYVDAKWGLINKKGEIVVPAIYDEVRHGRFIQKEREYDITHEGKLVEYQRTTENKEAISAIKEFYKRYIGCVSSNRPQSMTRVKSSFLTPELIERIGRLGESTGIDPILRSQDVSKDMLSSLNVRQVDKYWFMVSYTWDAKSDQKREIPLRVKRCGGRYIIDYITPIWNGAQYGDHLLWYWKREWSRLPYDDSTPTGFLERFYDEYTAVYCDMPEHLADKLSWWREHYLTDNARKQMHEAEEAEKRDGHIGYDLLIDDFDFDATWRPFITVEHADGDTYIVRYSGNGGSKSRRIEVAKSGSSFRINAIGPL
ncbi:MAG: WG repeat-containing protein [Mediterranea sp.]|jgi:hypothetical protein|nr:WG repeat-containing protein [Mediterranea sp.]